MNETRFKVLMYNGMYVDVNLLEKGIYTKSTPFLYSVDETIDTLLERAFKIQDMAGHHHVSAKYFENLRQCSMIEVEVLVVNK